MTTQPDDDQGGEDTTDSGPKGLRAALDREKARNEELLARANTAESQLMQSAFTTLGLNPAEGIGKAVAKLYDGAPDVEAIRAYAEAEFGWKSSTSNPAAEVIHEAQDRVDGVMQQGGSTVDPVNDDSLVGKIAKAEREGDWVKAMSLKMQMIGQ